MREAEQMRIKKRADNILYNHYKSNPRRETAGSKELQVCNPHCQQHRNSNKAELNPDRQGLVVRISRQFPCQSNLVGDGMTVLFANRSSAVAEQRCFLYKSHCFCPIHQTLACRSGTCGGMIGAGFVEK